MKSRKIISLLTAFMLTASVFTGCSSENLPEEQTASETSQSTVVTPGSEVTQSAEPLSDIAAEPGLIESITADSTKGLLASADTSFTIVLRKDMEEKDLKPLLALSSGDDFALHKIKTGTFSLKPAHRLETNSITSIGLLDKKGASIYRWAFQTECEMKVDEVYPAAGSTYVNVDTGIEFTFTAPADLESAKENISITPKIDGRFESHGNTVYFIPSSNLDTRTNYYVSIASGLRSTDGTEMTGDYNYYFSTSSSWGDTYIYTNDMSETFVDGDPVLIEVYASNDIIENGCSVALYRYPDTEAYRSSLEEFIHSGKEPEDYDFPTDGLECVYKNDYAEILTGTDRWSAAYIMLPENLEKGGYIAEIKTGSNGNDFRIQRHIQINPISVYAANLSGTSAFFINDTVSGRSFADAKISLMTDNNEYSAAANADGTAEIALTETKNGRGLLTVTAGGDMYSDIFDYSGDEEADPRDDYYMYLYTDREAYLPTDTVNVWGVIRPRKNDVPMPTDLSLIINEDYYGGEHNGASVDVRLNPDGTFTSVIPLENHADSWCQLELISGDTSLTHKFLVIREFEKPIYLMNIDVPDIAISPQTEPVPIDVSLTLYDGTPVENATINISSYQTNEEKDIITDKNGIAHTEMTFNDVSYEYPSYISVYARVTGIEDSYITSRASLVGFFRDTMLEYDYDKDSKSVTFTTSKTDPSKFDKENYYYGEYGYLRGDPTDTDVEATLRRSWYEKTESGSHYDFLQKKTVTDYDYEYKEEIVKKYKVICQNGSGVISDMPVGDSGSTYSLELSWKDTQGRETASTVYLDNWEYYRRDTVYRYYSFEPNKTTFTEDEDITITLLRNGAEETESGRIAACFYANDIIDTAVYDAAVFTHKMSKQYIPDVNVCGAYFDGKHVYPVHEYYDPITFDHSERELDVGISADKEKYSPAETVFIKVNVTDKDGKKADNANVLVSVVDEAAFALYPQYADPLEYIYQLIWPGWIDQYCSYVQHTLDTNGGAEKGGGGDEDTVRKDFLDTAFFAPAVTDSNGECTVSFDLPDNITQWRVTAIAVKETKTDYVYAGVSKSPVIATKSLFISPVMLDRYTEGDDIAVTAKLFGGSAATEIEYSISGNGQNNTITAHMNETANFGKLPAGEYTVRYKASENDESDTVEMKLEVVSSQLEIPVVKEYAFDALSSVSPEKWPVTVTFYNDDYRIYAETLFAIYRYAGSRLDLDIGQYFALKEMGFISEDEYITHFSDINSSGFAKLMRDSEESPELTALICAAAPELINRNSASARFNKLIRSKDSTHGDVAASYMGLAALGKPVITAINNILSGGAEGFDESDKLKLCAGLALAGDYDNALKYYNETVSVKTDGDKAYIDGSDPEKLTREAIITAAVLRLPEADKFARYLDEYIRSDATEYDSSSLQLMIYLRNYRSDAERNASFTYNNNGSTETVEIDEIFGKTLTFDRTQFEKADLAIKNGSIYTIAHYIGSEAEDSSDDITITKSISGSASPGDTVTVSFKVSGKNSAYCRIYDVIPSCGRFDESSSYANVSGQRITLYADKDGYASYKFRAVTSGDYVVEKAAVTNGREYSTTERSSITVK